MGRMRLYTAHADSIHRPRCFPLRCFHLGVCVVQSSSCGACVGCDDDDLILVHAAGPWLGGHMQAHTVWYCPQLCILSLKPVWSVPIMQA